ncbi:MAG: hypothetical protein JOY54_16240 [Acidobacteriaceae bacterium]|nr:hypothetical protein [Acidobacteriaceae bacterium]
MRPDKRGFVAGRTLFLASLAWTAFALAAPPASAAVNNFYVSTRGRDSNDGIAPEKAWRTISHASRAIKLGSAGAIIHVAPGIYEENVRISNSVPGTPGAWVTYISDVKWAALIRPPSARSPGIYNNAAYSIIENFDVGGAECTGIQQDSHHQIAIGNNVHNSAAGCDNSSGGGGIVDSDWDGRGNSLYANFVHDVGMVNASCESRRNSTIQGIYHEHAGGTIANNVVVNVCDAGISLWHAASATIIVNNTIVHNREGIFVGSGNAPCDTTGCSGNDYTSVINNITAFNTEAGIAEGASDGGRLGAHNRYRNNLTYSNGASFRLEPACDACVTTGNPLFVNDTGTASGDYQLRSGSPAVGAGTVAYAPSTDYVGEARKAPITIGAFQSPKCCSR